MHENVIHVVSRWFLVSFRTKACKCHLMKIDAKWIDTIQKNIKSQVIFKFVNQVWFVDVLLDNVANFFIFYIVLV